MQKWLLIFLLVPVLISCSSIKLTAPGKADVEVMEFTKGKEIVKVGKGGIHEGLLDFLAKINPRVKAQLANPQMRKQLLVSLIDQEILYQASLKKGLGNEPDIALKAAFYRRGIVAQALMEQEMLKKSQEYYNEKKDAEFTKVQISDIEIKIAKAVPPAETADPTVSPPAVPLDPKAEALKKAQDVKARLVAGEEFAKVAGEVSDDLVTKKRGGDLGAISRNDKRLGRRNLLTLGQTAFTLKNGDVSDPIETTDAYHIIKVTSELQVTPFEEADRVIRFQIQKEVHDSLIAELKKEYPVSYTNSADAPAESAPSPVAPPAPEGSTPPVVPAIVPAIVPPTAPAPTPDAGTPQATVPVPAPEPVAEKPAPAPTTPPSEAPVPPPPAPPAQP